MKLISKEIGQRLCKSKISKSGVVFFAIYEYIINQQCYLNFVIGTCLNNTNIYAVVLFNIHEM